MAIIKGTPGDDFLGTSQDPFDIIDGGDGFDFLFVDYRDLTTALTLVVDTTPGSTTVASNGTTITNVEAFEIIGTEHADTLGAGNSSDVIYGGSGDDRVYGRDGRDELWGQDGNDTLDGGDGNDILYGDWRDDTFTPGNDVLIGGAGDDDLYGGGGNNTFSGGDGNDEIISNFFGSNLGVDIVDGGDGNDIWLADLDVLSSGVTLVMDTTPGATTTASFGTTLTNVEALLVLGSLYNDVLGGGVGNDTLAGNDGDDEIRGAVGNDELRGNNGNDVVDGGIGNDIVAGGSGNNTLTGGDGNDRLESGDQYAGVGVDAIDGGAGTDRWVGEFQLATSALTLLMDNRAGATSTASNGTTIRNIESAELHGSTYADIISATHGDDIVDGWSGDDLLLGGRGADSLIGGAGQDVLIGGDGADHFVYQAVDDSTVTGRDALVDFSQAENDIIDLSQIDADTGGAGNQAFGFIGDDNFSGVAGQLRYETDGWTTHISGDVNGDSAADFEIALVSSTAPTVEDFLL